MHSFGLFLFTIFNLAIGIIFLLWPTNVIHYIFGRPSRKISKSITDAKYVPINIEFLRLADEDPEMLNDKYPASILVIRIIGIISLLIFIVLLC
jgi:hypothetical protein